MSRSSARRSRTASTRWTSPLRGVPRQGSRRRGRRARRPVTIAEIAAGKAEVGGGEPAHDVGPDGKINRARSSSCADPEVRAPVGTIDPWPAPSPSTTTATPPPSTTTPPTHVLLHGGDGRLRRLRAQAAAGGGAGCAHPTSPAAAATSARQARRHAPRPPRAPQRIYDAIGLRKRPDASPWTPRASREERGAELTQPEERSLAAEATLSPRSATRLVRRPQPTAYEVTRCAARVPGINPLLASSLELNDIVLLAFPASSSSSPRPIPPPAERERGENIHTPPHSTPAWLSPHKSSLARRPPPRARRYQLHARPAPSSVATAAYPTTGSVHPDRGGVPEGARQVTFAADRDEAGRSSAARA